MASEPRVNWIGFSHHASTTGTPNANKVDKMDQVNLQNGKTFHTTSARPPNPVSWEVAVWLFHDSRAKLCLTSKAAAAPAETRKGPHAMSFNSRNAGRVMAQATD
ncbi:hypothetical protein E4U42_001269 [Claviceps africana]|uniref:Uncharacterized protein n=1 Tax=Claviceps africana TaxID=83212 RepID=A0A8K0IZP6_9HYPO|nr:hypothetical protein E4U42_001269 [Claviceps africana]